MTWTSPVRRAVTYRFRLTSEHSELGRWFDELVGAMPVVDADPLTAEWAEWAEWTVRLLADEHPPRWSFLVDGTVKGSSANVEHLLTTMVQTLNGQVVAHWSGAVCHAGCVSIDGAAILLPADPEAGKTTLTCGLVRAGFAYVTDEGVVVHGGTTRIEPYPKPMSLDPGSWFLFPELEPQSGIDTGDDEAIQWQIAPMAIRDDAVSAPCDARWIVFPKYVEGADTVLTPIGRAEALVDLARNTFNFNQHSREYLDQLAVVVEACDCYRLAVGTLDDAVACIQELVGRGC